MPSYRDLYPARWLRPDDFVGKRVRVTTQTVTLEKLFNPTSKQHEQKLILAFVGKQLRLILNQTQCKALAQLSGSEDYSQWRGYDVHLSVARAANGKNTFVISPASGGQQPALSPAFEPEAEDYGEGSDDGGDINYSTPAQAAAQEPVHGQGNGHANSGARPGASNSATSNATPGGVAPGVTDARPFNNSNGPCPECHAPVGRPHTKTCKIALEGSGARPGTSAQGNAGARPAVGPEIFDEQPANAGARPQAQPAVARPAEITPIDDMGVLMALIANIYGSGHELSKNCSEFMRKAANADHDSTSRMTKTYFEALQTLLSDTLDCLPEETELILTALAGYTVNGAALPGQILHGYLVKPLRDHDDKAIDALTELLGIIREIQAEWATQAELPY